MHARECQAFPARDVNKHVLQTRTHTHTQTHASSRNLQDSLVENKQMLPGLNKQIKMIAGWNGSKYNT